MVAGATTFPPLKRGHYGRWAFESIYVYGDNGGKPYNRASPVEMHPYSRYAGLPPEGEVCSPLSFRPHKYIKI